VEKKIWQDSLESLGKAISRFSDIVHDPGFINGVLKDQDSAIQRFEFCIELYWKVLKKILAYEKIIVQTPREVLQKSYQYHLIDDEKIWLSMLDDRNKTSHMYQEEMAAEICKRIPDYYKIMKVTYEKLEKRMVA